MSGVYELPPLEPVADLTVGELESTIRAARAEADAIRAEAYQAGVDEGRQAGLADVSAAAGALHAALAGLGEEREALIAGAEVAAVELAFAVAEQILSAALEVQPERIVDVVRGALRRLVERERVTVLVHPDDLECVRLAAPDLIAELGGMEHCEVQAERRVSRGGAVVRTAEGEVDASLATKLNAARETVAAELRGGSDVAVVEHA